MCKQSKNCIADFGLSIINFLIYLFIALAFSLFSDVFLIIALKPYEHIHFNKNMPKFLEHNIVENGLDTVTTELFGILIFVFLIFFLIYSLHFKKLTPYKLSNRFRISRTYFLSKISIILVEVYSIVIGFLNSNIPSMLSGNYYALITTLTIPSIVFTSLVGLTISYEKKYIIDLLN